MEPPATWTPAPSFPPPGPTSSASSLKVPGVWGGANRKSEGPGQPRRNRPDFQCRVHDEHSDVYAEMGGRIFWVVDLGEAANDLSLDDPAVDRIVWGKGTCGVMDKRQWKVVCALCKGAPGAGTTVYRRDTEAVGGGSLAATGRDLRSTRFDPAEPVTNRIRFGSSRGMPGEGGGAWDLLYFLPTSLQRWLSADSLGCYNCSMQKCQEGGHSEWVAASTSYDTVVEPAPRPGF